MTDQTLISGAPRVKLKWYQVIDPITKLLFILDMTLLSFASMNLLLQAGLILVATLLLLFSKLSSTIFKALGFSLFLICTMLIIQGLFYSRNQTVLFSVLGVSFYKEGWFTPPLWVVEYWWLFWPVAFLWWPRVFQKTRPIWTVRIVL